MNCPKCKKGEIEPAGTCPVCGHGIVKSAQAAYLPFPASDNILSFPVVRVKQKSEPRAHHGSANEKSVPSWRLEISQKVQQVLRARENKASGIEVPDPPESIAVGSGCGMNALGGSSLPSSLHPAAAIQEVSTSGPAAAMSSPNKGQDGGCAGISIDSPIAAEAPTPRLFKTLVLETHPVSNPLNPNIIEASGRVQEQPAASEMQLEPRKPLQHASSVISEFNIAFPADPAFRGLSKQNDSDRVGLLLSRTLSGLIDFITVLFCSIPFFFCLVYLLGYENIDSFELWVLLGICGTLFLLYSVFFVTFSGQTIGMMITNLQVVDGSGELPSYSMALRRVLAFLVAGIPGGLGLAWGLLDRNRRCLHDLLSRTTVIRVDSPDLL